ncbi:ubiquitin carrier protein 7 [Zea mays]|uniref:PHD finger protein ALFIN-LIKE n=1 Tax=Zea mays TaxID=4577 RepID=A0A1D6EQ52_MAIZE|nr:ubiquitin carrier protein 7 [Zea mays]ONM22058.1 ubiquitin carrier protein 7 [Zea mays]
MAMPGNCNVAMIPVVAYEGATAADYQWFVEGGFFLSYYLTDTEDDDYYDQCQACSYRAGHGQCRTIVSDNGFQCYCSDGVYSTTACGTKRANWKTTIVVESKRELNQECSIYIGLRMNEHQERVREEAYTVGTCPSQWRCSGDGGDRHWHGEAAKPTAAEPHLEEEVENLCRYELPNESWEVNLPPEKVSPELPVPTLGINFARDGIQKKEWLSMVAAHSDAWLLSVAFYLGAQFGFNKNYRVEMIPSYLYEDFPSKEWFEQCCD